MAEQQDATASAEWRAHWPLLASATAGLTFPATATYSLGLFMDPLSKAFGWSRADVTLGLMMMSLLLIPLAPPAGALIDRFGARRIGVPGIFVAIVSIACFGFANGSIAQWLTLWGIFALATLLTKPTVWTAAVSKAFSASRGLALGVLLCATSISQSLTPIVAERLIALYGWRMAYHLLAIGWGGVAFILVLLFFHDAYGPGARVTTRKGPPPGATGYTFREAMRTRPVWQILAAVLVGSLMTVGVSIHLVPLLSAMGLGRGEAAALAGLAGLSGVAGKLLTGILLDRVRGSVVPFLSFALPSLAMAIFLAKLTSTPAIALGVILMGFSSGASMQSSAYLITRYAGMRSFGAVYGLIASIIGLALGVSPWVAGRIYDLTGNYDLLLAITIPGTIVSGLLLVGLGPYPVFRAVETPGAATSPDAAERPFAGGPAAPARN